MEYDRRPRASSPGDITSYRAPGGGGGCNGHLWETQSVRSSIASPSYYQAARLSTGGGGGVSWETGLRNTLGGGGDSRYGDAG
jgi:hypothetical protein